MQGIRLKSMRGRGGVVENITFDHFEINEVSHEAIQINMFYEFSTVIPKSNTPSEFKDITIKNVTGTGNSTAVMLRGLPEQKLKNISLENISLHAEKYLICDDIDGLRLTDVRLN